MSRRRGRAMAGTAVGLVVLALPAVAVAAARRAQVPVEPDRDTGRTWAAQELAGREYQAARPGLLTRFATWLWEQLQRVPTFSGTGPKLIMLGIVLAALGLVIFAVQRSGGLRRQTRGGGDAVFGDPTRSAADHRAAAEVAERAENWQTAVLERFRAVTRELEERAVLVPQPGRTADEVALDAGAWLPPLAPTLRSGAQLFDDVRYGDRPASAATAAALRELDEAVRQAKPAAQAVPAAAGLVAPS